MPEIIPAIIQHFVWIIAKPSLKYFCRLKIVGRDNLNQITRNAIFASNHSSELDPIIIAASLPFFSRHLPIFFTSREKTFYKNMGWKKFIYGGILFKMCGAYQVHVGLKDYEQALQTHIDLLHKGKSLLIFPHGKRVLGGEIVRAKGGVSFLANTTELPIVPMLIQGAENITPANFLFKRKQITVVIGKPISAKDIFKNGGSIVVGEVRNDYKDAANKLMTLINHLA